jgi:hypothetical protein
MKSTIAFCVGIALAALSAEAQRSQPIPLDEHAQLCVNGHPRPRSTHVTYGGLTPMRGYQRDHWLSLCLGGRDDADNIWYQPIDDARRKDKVERHLCDRYCSGGMSLEHAVACENTWQSTYYQIYGEWPGHVGAEFESDRTSFAASDCR